jgi:5-methylthioribose kinase
MGDEIKVIDPEFCFYGLREFDLGAVRSHVPYANRKKVQ